MAVSHSVYAVYGVVVAPPRQREALDAALEAQAHRSASGNPADVRVQLFTVGDDEHIVLGAGYEQLEPNTYRAVPFLPVSGQRDGVLLEYARSLGLTVRAGPCWLVVHDLSQDPARRPSGRRARQHRPPKPRYRRSDGV